jgi:hypothetical protein
MIENLLLFNIVFLKRTLAASPILLLVLTYKIRSKIDRLFPRRSDEKRILFSFFSFGKGGTKRKTAIKEKAMEEEEEEESTKPMSTIIR